MVASDCRMTQADVLTSLQLSTGVEKKSEDSLGNLAHQFLIDRTQVYGCVFRTFVSTRESTSSA